MNEVVALDPTLSVFPADGDTLLGAVHWKFHEKRVNLHSKRHVPPRPETQAAEIFLIAATWIQSAQVPSAA